MSTLTFYIVADMVMIALIAMLVMESKKFSFSVETKKAAKVPKPKKNGNELDSFVYNGINKDHLLYLIHESSPLKPTLEELELYFKMLKKVRTPNDSYVTKMKERFEIQ